MRVNRRGAGARRRDEPRLVVHPPPASVFGVTGLLLLSGLIPAAWATDPAATVDVVAVSVDTTLRTRGAAEGKPIRSITINARNIFDPLPPGPLQPVYRLANALHVRTRRSTIRDQILLREGQRWTRDRGQATVRHLRTLDFLEPRRIEAQMLRDSVDVMLQTRDTWTTQFEFDFERASGRQFGSFGFTERNLFGLGKSVNAAYHEDPIGISRSIGFSDPGVLGSRVRFNYSAAKGNTGASDRFSLGVPFYTEDTRWSYGIQGDRVAGEAHLFRNNAEVAVLDEHVKELEASLGHAWFYGPKIIRLTGSFWSMDRRLGATQWDTSRPAPPASLIGPEEELRLRRLAIEARVWEPHYVERVGIDRVDQIEDIDLGPSIAVKGGMSSRALGGNADEGYLRIKLDGGVETPFGFGRASSTLSTRWRRTPIETEVRGEGRWISQPRPGHALIAAVEGVSGYRMPRTFQTVVGGLNGLRAYPVHAVAGTQVMRWNIEDRHVVFRDVMQLVTLGLAEFYDGARGWGPGAEGSTVFHAAGVGLRIAPARAALGASIRIDMAWPVYPTRDGRRDPVLSVGSSHAF